MNIKTGLDVFKHEWKQGVPPLPASLGEFPGERHVRELWEDGITVVEGFWDAAKCEKVVEQIDSVILEKEEQVWKDDKASDHRIYGAGGVIEECREFAEDPGMMALMEAHEGQSLISFALAARLNAVEGNLGSGGGWHRDQALKIQSKAMIYLVDVGPENGPFEYVLGSQKRRFVVESSFRHGFELGKNRYEDSEVAPFLEKSKVIAGRAGDLVLFNSRGLHRGTPIQAGTRYSITNYYYAKTHGVPSHIQKLFVS